MINLTARTARKSDRTKEKELDRRRLCQVPVYGRRKTEKTEQTEKAEQITYNRKKIVHKNINFGSLLTVHKYIELKGLNKNMDLKHHNIHIYKNTSLWKNHKYEQ